MKHANLKGTGVALITPFDDNMAIDFRSLGYILDHVMEGGVDFLVVLGTTAEASLLSIEEKHGIIDFVRNHTAGKIPLVLGFGGIDTERLVENFSDYDFTGIEAILSVTPYYVKPSQEGLIRHYTKLADASPRPVILYNVPGRTGVNMTADTTLELSSHPNIIGIKEASGKLFQTEEILSRKPDDFLLYSGEDALTFHLMNLGSDGVISVVANAFPKEVATIVKEEEEQRFKKARNAHFSLKLLTKAVFADGNPCGIKYVLSSMGLCRNIVRLPLVPVSREVEALIDQELELLK